MGIEIKLESQLIALTKSIRLTNPEDPESALESFFAGSLHDPTAMFSHPIINWWKTRQSRALLENVAEILIRDPEFADCSADEVSDTVARSLREGCADGTFKPDRFQPPETLFESRVMQDVRGFGRLLVDGVLRRIRASLSSWCTAFPIPRLEGPSLVLEHHGLGLLALDDAAAWERLVARRFETLGWDPRLGGIPGTGGGTGSFNHNHFAVSFDRGDSNGALLASELKIRLLVAVVAAEAALDGVRLHTCDANPPRYCTLFRAQYPKLFSSARSVHQSVGSKPIGELAPYLLNAVELSTRRRDALSTWFDQLAARELNAQSLIRKCGHFVNLGLTTRGIASPIFFFIALDALFGDESGVEQRIVEGVRRLIGEEAAEKTSWFYRLRNDLVHGGARYVKEWQKHSRYVRRFGTDPEEDLKLTSFEALRLAPSATLPLQAPVA